MARVVDQGAYGVDRKVFYLTPKIRIPLRAPQADARLANARK